MSRSSGSWDYIVPGSPEESLFYLKISSSSPPFGDPMPLQFDYRTETEIERIGLWIEVGPRSTDGRRLPGPYV